MTEREFVAKVFQFAPSARYEHAPDCLEVLACDCEKPRGFHTGKCASLEECDCSGKFIGLRWKKR
jgi:hypothetical protein